MYILMLFCLIAISLANFPVLADNLAPLQKEPILLKSEKITIPPSVKRLGITGTITLQLLINEQGLVDSAVVIQGLEPVIDSLVLKYALNLTFTPAVADNRPVPVLIIFEHTVISKDLVENVKPVINFQGKVLERGTRRPVPDLLVTLSYSDSSSDSTIPMPFGLYMQQIGSFEGQQFQENIISTWTDSAGIFRFKSLPAGKADLKIIGADMQVYQKQIVIPGHHLLDELIRINRSSYSENEIVIYGKSNSNQISRRTLSTNEISNVAGFDGDAIKVVQALPGVARPAFGLGSVIIRGSPTWDSKFYLDGVPIPQLYHFGGLKSVYNSYALESVNMYPGGFDVRSGNSIAGIVELNSRNAVRERTKGYADVNLTDVNMFAEGPVNNRVGIMASVRRSYIGEVIGIVAKRFDVLNQTIMAAPYYFDFLVRTDIDLAPSHKLFFTLFGSKDAMEFIVPEFDNSSSEMDSLVDRLRKADGFNMVMAGYDVNVNSRIKNKFRTALIQGEGGGMLLGMMKWDYKSLEFVLRNELTVNSFAGITMSSGVDFCLKRLRQNSFFLTRERFFYRDTSNSVSGIVSPYVHFEYNLHPSLNLSTGIRFDYYPELEYRGSLLPEFWNYKSLNNRIGFNGEPALRFSAKYNLNKKHAFTASIGSYNQTPQPLGIVTHSYFGEPALPASKARQVTLGYKWLLSDLIYADIQLYHNQQWDLPQLSGFNNLVWLNSDEKLYSGGGKGRSYGLELMLRHDQNKRMFGWISYSLSKSERFNSEQNRYIPFESDQTHNLQCVLNYRFKRNWQAGTRVRLVSGNPYTPILYGVFDGTNRYYQPVYGPENSERNRSFFQADFRVEKKMIFDKWLGSLYLDLKNAFWLLYKSPEYTLYNFDYSKKITISTPIIPSLGFRAEF